MGEGSEVADSLADVTSVWALAAAWARMLPLGSSELGAGYEEEWEPQSAPPEEGSEPELVLWAGAGSFSKTEMVSGSESSSVTGKILGAGDGLVVME